jgi:hypothetical protein
MHNLTLTELEQNIIKLNKEISYQQVLLRRGYGNALIIVSLKQSKKAFENALADRLYEQAEAEADRIECIREELLCAYGL